MRPGLAGDTGRSTISGARYTEKMARDRRFSVSAAPLDVAAVGALVSARGYGAVTIFTGLVREHNAGHKVLWLDYEAFEPLAVRAFEQIDREASGRWPGVALAIHHRTGRLEIGEASVVIAAGSPHRAEAFAASRYAIERIKQIAPIWKHEHFEGGTTWIEGATADPDDEQARATAFERACT